MAMMKSSIARELIDYRLRAVGNKANKFVLRALREQLRMADLKPDIFMAIQSEFLALMREESTLEMDPLERLRDLVQGIVLAFQEKKMQESEAARVTACSAIMFFPRGKVEQFDVAKMVACELILTKVNLDTEMVQVSQGIGKGFITLSGLATLLPKAINPDTDYLSQLFEQLRAGIWAGTMHATDKSTAHGNTNVQQMEAACDLYIKELLHQQTAGRLQSLLGP